MKDKLIKNIKWVLVGILLFCFTIIALLITKNKIETYDNYVYESVSKLISNKMTFVFKVITSFVNPIVITIFTVLITCVFIVKGKDKKAAALFVLNLCIIAILNYILKNIFARTRPEDINIIIETGYSFPSGHSAVSMAFYGYIIYLINIKDFNKVFKIISTIVISILIFLIGVSRIYLGVHYASDVTAAFMLSLSYLIVYIHIVKLIQNYFQNDKKCIDKSNHM